MPKNNRAKTLNKAKKNYNGLKYPKKNKSCKNKLKKKKNSREVNQRIMIKILVL